MKRLIAKKVMILDLLELLQDLYHRGVDFVDISGSAGEDQDRLGISFGKEYMSEEFDGDFENLMTEDFSQEKESNIDVKPLSDDDINRLAV